MIMIYSEAPATSWSSHRVLKPELTGPEPLIMIPYLFVKAKSIELFRTRHWIPKEACRLQYADQMIHIETTWEKREIWNMSVGKRHVVNRAEDMPIGCDLDLIILCAENPVQGVMVYRFRFDYFTFIEPFLENMGFREPWFLHIIHVIRKCIVWFNLLSSFAFVHTKLQDLDSVAVDPLFGQMLSILLALLSCTNM